MMKSLLSAAATLSRKFIEKTLPSVTNSFCAGLRLSGTRGLLSFPLSSMLIVFPHPISIAQDAIASTPAAKIPYKFFIISGFK